MKPLESDKTIQEIIARLTRLEKAVFMPGQNKGTQKADKDSANQGLPGHILKLRGQGFFKEPRTASEVRGKLRSKYPCEHDRVAMALLRLGRRKQLRRASKIVDKVKQVAYVW